VGRKGIFTSFREKKKKEGGIQFNFFRYLLVAIRKLRDITRGEKDEEIRMEIALARKKNKLLIRETAGGGANLIILRKTLTSLSLKRTVWGKKDLIIQEAHRKEGNFYTMFVGTSRDIASERGRM